jgi:hypothetical protein
MLRKDATDRITLGEILNDPWVQMGNVTEIANPPHTELDPEIVRRMRKLGIDCTNLKSMLVEKNRCDIAVAYKMLLREKLTGLSWYDKHQLRTRPENCRVEREKRVCRALTD